jgi:hypothetical protein
LTNHIKINTKQENSKREDDKALSSVFELQSSGQGGIDSPFGGLPQGFGKRNLFRLLRAQSQLGLSSGDHIGSRQTQEENGRLLLLQVLQLSFSARSGCLRSEEYQDCG